jgi:hypothetical protein
MAKTYADKILTECIGEELPPCQAACPLDIRVREKLARMTEGNMAGALAVLLSRHFGPHLPSPLRGGLHPEPGG